MLGTWQTFWEVRSQLLHFLHRPGSLGGLASPQLHIFAKHEFCDGHDTGATGFAGEGTLEEELAAMQSAFKKRK